MLVAFSELTRVERQAESHVCSNTFEIVFIVAICRTVLALQQNKHKQLSKADRPARYIPVHSVIIIIVALYVNVRKIYQAK